MFPGPTMAARALRGACVDMRGCLFRLWWFPRCAVPGPVAARADGGQVGADGADARRAERRTGAARARFGAGRYRVRRVTSPRPAPKTAR
ncbi:hypothetical protein TPA0909_01510 [Streptomyces albus]|nr:hypothetical protein TPA0909_01510 [Streptomyces albus]